MKRKLNEPYSMGGTRVRVTHLLIMIRPQRIHQKHCLSFGHDRCWSRNLP